MLKIKKKRHNNESLPRDAYAPFPLVLQAFYSQHHNRLKFNRLWLAHKI